MTNYNTLRSNLKRGILRFSEKISEGLSRPDFKFVSQMIYGMLGSQSCHLSKIGRALDEGISLKKTIDRLSRNLNEFDGGAKLFHNYLRKVKNSISDRTILIADDSDITKPCSSKLEEPATVRDGSTGKLGNGYHIKKSNIRAFDRGYDANIYFEYLIDNREKFIIRVKKNRNVIYKGERKNILALAKKFKGKYSLKFEKKNGDKADCKISIIPIKLPCRPNESLNLVVCHGFGKEPLMLITNLKSDDNRLAVAVTKVYLMRWRIEEFYGFKKQQFDFEDFRVRSLKSIRNLDLLLTIAIGYIGFLSEKPEERSVVMEIIAISKRIYATPKFLFYSIADGLFAIFAKCKHGVADMLRITYFRKKNETKRPTTPVSARGCGFLFLPKDVVEFSFFSFHLNFF